MTYYDDDAPDYTPGRVPGERPGPTGGLRDRNRRERTRQICETSLVLFLERGVEVASVDEISRAAGIAKGTFYRYFENKDQVVASLVGPLHAAVMEALDDASERLESCRVSGEVVNTFHYLAAAMLNAIMRDPSLSRLYLQCRRLPRTGLVEPLHALADEVFDRCISFGQIAQAHGLVPAGDLTTVTAMEIGAVEELLHQHLEGLRPQASPEALLHVAVQHVLAAFSAGVGSA